MERKHTSIKFKDVNFEYIKNRPVLKNSNAIINKSVINYFALPTFFLITPRIAVETIITTGEMLKNNKTAKTARHIMMRLRRSNMTRNRVPDPSV